MEWAGDGPWQTEPDREEWRDPATGLVCLAKRGPWGAWCGYVAVPPGHHLHGLEYSDLDVEVHGGLTYADRCQGEEGVGICHVPLATEAADVWWFGFDCGHLFDLIPGLRSVQEEVFAGATMQSGTYRTLGYVRAEITRLAAQLA